MAEQRISLGAKVPMATASRSAATLRHTIEAIADAGFDYLSTEDHVVGRALKPGAALLNNQKPIQETFVTLTYAAAIAPGLGLSSGVLILPQRQTALVAKQAAGVDLLSGGKLRLGVGIGWSELEYDVLGAPWRGRGHMLEEQIDLLRRFWSEPSVSEDTTAHRFEGAMIAPRPMRQPIPIWIGAGSAAGIERAARIADGFISLLTPETGIDTQVRALRQQLAIVGRNPEQFPIEAWIDLGGKPAPTIFREYDHLTSLGITRITLVPETIPGDLERKLEGLVRARDIIGRAG